MLVTMGVADDLALNRCQAIYNHHESLWSLLYNNMYRTALHYNTVFAKKLFHNFPKKNILAQ